MVFVQFVIPRFTNNAYESQVEALSAPTSKFELKENISYKYFFNCLYEDLKYDENLYQNSQNCSSKFIQHINQIGREIKKEVSLDSHIIEIGCGKGDFIQLLCKLGFNNLTGFDEAYQGDSDLFKKRYFSKEDQDLKADSIILRHTLEHIPNPFGFLEKIVSINNNENCNLFLEVPCFNHILKTKAYWDLTFEHCNYFTEDSFKEFMPGCEVKNVFDGQYLFVKSNANLIKTKSKEKESNPLNLNIFFPSMHNKENKIDVNLDLPHNIRYWLWGSATKGLMHLWHRKINDPLYIPPLSCIDINPAKQNKYLPCLGYKIRSPEYLYKNAKEKDIVYISNSSYKNEIEILIKNNTNYNLILKNI